MAFAALAVVGLKLVELALLPVNFFAFRAWEALIVRRVHFALPGPFYPNSRVEMFEDGDIAPRTPLAVKKRVLFVTDRFGYRKNDSPDDRWDVVIVGDSFTAGASLTQEDALSERLQESSGRRVYPLAPASLDDFLNNGRFAKHAPRTVIFELAEGFVADGSPGGSPAYGVAVSRRQRLLRPLLARFPRLAVLCDRLDKGMMYGAASAWVKRRLRMVPAPRAAGGMLFRDPPELSDGQIDRFALGLEGYCDRFQRRGIRFLFLPIPSKETVYFDLRGATKRPDGFAHLLARVRRSGVEVVDVLAVFEGARRRSPGELLYQPDDSHWNPRGAALAADLLAKVLDTRGFGR